MSRTGFWHGWVKTGVVAVAACSGAGTVAWAHGGDGSLVHACSAGVGSPLLLSDTAGNGCANAGTRVDWSIAGPAGPAGPTGPAGPAGAAGKSISDEDVIRVITKRSANDAQSNKVVLAKCPEQSILLSGGYEIDGQNATRDVTESRPGSYNGGRVAAGQEPRSWLAVSRQGLNGHIPPGNERFRLLAYAVCKGPLSAFTIGTPKKP